MKTLDEFNKDQHKKWAKINGDSPRKNRIACPECGAELFDSYPNMLLTSNPPQKNIHCEKCGYKGYRIA